MACAAARAFASSAMLGLVFIGVSRGYCG